MFGGLGENVCYNDTWMFNALGTSKPASSSMFPRKTVMSPFSIGPSKPTLSILPKKNHISPCSSATAHSPASMPRSPLTPTMQELPFILIQQLQSDLSEAHSTIATLLTQNTTLLSRLECTQQEIVKLTNGNSELLRELLNLLKTQTRNGHSEQPMR
jgi:hypothetical protein